MQRNIISERVLGMPREYAADKDKPLRRGPAQRVTLSTQVTAARHASGETV